MKEERNVSYEDFLAGVSSVAQSRQDREFLDQVGARPESGPPQEPIAVGERVKRIREQKGLSLKDMAQRTGLSEAMIRQIEDELISPPLGTLIRLGKALDMQMGTIISPAGPRPYTIVRADERKAVSRYASKQGQRLGYSYQHLAFDKGDRNMEPFLVTLEPSDVEDELSSHDGEEFIFILEGQMEAHLGKKMEILNPGDAIYYNSTVPHLVKCHGGRETRIVAVIFAQNR